MSHNHFQTWKTPSPARIGGLLVLAVCVLPCGTKASAQTEKDDAARLLAAKGMVRIGDTWCVPDEVRLRNAIEPLDRGERRCVALQQQVDELIRQNTAAGTELTQAQAALKQAQELLKSLPGGNAQRPAVEEEIKQQTARMQAAKARYVAGDRWGQDVPLKPLLLELIQVRQDVMVSLATIRELAGSIGSLYAPLREDREVSAALRTLGSPQAMGPIRTYDTDLRRATKIEQTTLGGRVPIYREGKKLRVNALLNEQTPATFTLLESRGETWIPASMAEAVGIVPAADARRAMIRATPQRTLAVQVVSIPKLRIGKWVLKDVEAYLLPPEGEDLGAQLSRDTPAAAKVVVDPQQLNVRVDE